jgi:hypothetical protein
LPGQAAVKEDFEEKMIQNVSHHSSSNQRDQHNEQIGYIRIRTGHAQQNLALMRRIAMNMLNSEKSSRESLKGKRQLAVWDEAFFESVIFKTRLPWELTLPPIQSLILPHLGLRGCQIIIWIRIEA